MSMSISTAIPPTCCPRWRAGNPRISLPPEKSGRSAPTRSKLSRSPESRQPCLALRCMAGKPFVHRGRRNPDRPSNHARFFPRLSSRDNQGSHLWRGLGILVDVHGLSPDDRAASQPPPSPVSAREQPIETLQLGRLPRFASSFRAILKNDHPDMTLLERTRLRHNRIEWLAPVIARIVHHQVDEDRHQEGENRSAVADLGPVYAAVPG